MVYLTLDGGGQTGLTCACFRISGVRDVGVSGAEFVCVLCAAFASISINKERDFFPIPRKTVTFNKKSKQACDFRSSRQCDQQQHTDIELKKNALTILRSHSPHESTKYIVYTNYL